MVVILNKFFIWTGGLFLSAINFFKSLSPENIEFKLKEDKEIDLGIFRKLNIRLNTNKSKNEDTKLDKLRDLLLKYLLTNMAIKLILAVTVLLFAFSSLEIVGMFLTIISMIYILIIYGVYVLYLV